jgi:DNA-binding NarL/FixJ family response regulator
MLRFFSAPPPAAEPFPELTTRERQILDLLAAGLSNSAIADRLDLASKTVANNVSAIFTKLGIADRSAAIVRARNAGLGTDGPNGSP